MEMNTEATFNLFPHLPTELRLKIWQLAAPEPSVIFSAENECIRYTTLNNERTFLAVIQTCREARGQLIYTVSPSESASSSRANPKYKACRFPPSSENVFFSFDVDTIHFMFARCAIIFPQYTILTCLPTI